MELFEEGKIIGKTVTCIFKNNETVIGNVIDFNNKWVIIEGLYKVIVSVDYIGALLIDGGLDG